MNDYERGMTDALKLLQNFVESRCKLLDGMRESMRVQNNGPHVADNDLGGMLNAQTNIYRGLVAGFETAMMRTISEARKQAPVNDAIRDAIVRNLRYKLTEIEEDATRRKRASTSKDLLLRDLGLVEKRVTEAIDMVDKL